MDNVAETHATSTLRALNSHKLSQTTPRANGIPTQQDVFLSISLKTEMAINRRVGLVHELYESEVSHYA